MHSCNNINMMISTWIEHELMNLDIYLQMSNIYWNHKIQSYSSCALLA